MSKNVLFLFLLTSKILATMMCLLSRQISQTLVSLSTDCLYLTNSGCVFYISKLLRTSRPKSHQQPTEFKAYPHDVSLCVVALIKLYLDKTAALKHDVNSMFFITYASPHKPVSSRTLTKWVSDILHNAEIQTKTLTTCSLLSLSTSNAFSGGLPLTEIAKAAEWTNVKTFDKFYNKLVIDNNFPNVLLTTCMLEIAVCMTYVVLYVRLIGIIFP